MGASAYALWGLSALYWPLLLPASAGEILAHRVVWSVFALVAITTVVSRWGQVRAILRSSNALLLLAAASVLTAVNWWMFIWATTHDRVIDASMGYFISPLVMVALGFYLFGERPTRRQWAAVGLGAAAVIILAIAYGSPPWIALVLATTFGVYGWTKKRVNLHAVDAMVIETAVLLLPAVGFVALTQLNGTATFGQETFGHTALMIGASFVMLAPMVLFSAAGNVIPLSTLGLMQYLEPVIQFLIGLLIFKEAMPAERWAAFVLVWAAIVMLSYDVLHQRRRAAVTR